MHSRASIFTRFRRGRTAVPVSSPASGTKKSRKSSTALVFHPADEAQFKDALLKSKKAHFELTYNTGAVKSSLWDAQDFKDTSNLRGNIQSKTFWRSREKEGLVKVEVYID